MAQMKYSDNMTQVRRVDAELQNELKKYLHPRFPVQVQLRVKREGNYETLEMVVFDNQNRGVIESYVYGLNYKALKEDMLKSYIRYIAAKSIDILP